MSELKRLVLDFRNSELVVQALYRTESGVGPNTKARRREITELAREGLRRALASLESEADAELVGCSGFSQREDVLLATASPDANKLVKGA
jgi:hypothetical protein